MVTTVGVVVVWAAVVVWSVLPPTPEAYLAEAVSAAQDAVSATGTVLLVGRADLDDQLLPPYTDTALEDAQQAAATAAQDLLAAPVPDADSLVVRLDLVPLLVTASDGITAVATASSEGDRDAVEAALAALVPVRGELDQFVQDNQ